MEWIEKVLNFFSTYWDAIIATILLVIASADKVAIIFLKTAKNIRTEWREFIR